MTAAPSQNLLRTITASTQSNVEPFQLSDTHLQQSQKASYIQPDMQRDLLQEKPSARCRDSEDRASDILYPDKKMMIFARIFLDKSTATN